MVWDSPELKAMLNGWMNRLTILRRTKFCDDVPRRVNYCAGEFSICKEVEQQSTTSSFTVRVDKQSPILTAVYSHRSRCSPIANSGRRKASPNWKNNRSDRNIVVQLNDKHGQGWQCRVLREGGFARSRSFHTSAPSAEHSFAVWSIEGGTAQVTLKFAPEHTSGCTRPCFRTKCKGWSKICSLIIGYVFGPAY